MQAVQIALDPATGLLAMKMPSKGARWQRGLKNMGEAMKRALAELEGPFEIDFVDYPKKENEPNDDPES